MVRFDTATAQAESPSCNITMVPVLCNAELVKNLRPILEPNWALICRMWDGCPLSDVINWQQQGGLKATLCCLLFLCFRKTACKLYFRRSVVERYCFFERVFSHFSPQTVFGDFVFLTLFLIKRASPINPGCPTRRVSSVQLQKVLVACCDGCTFLIGSLLKYTDFSRWVCSSLGCTCLKCRTEVYQFAQVRPAVKWWWLTAKQPS